jgi:hypothetical protein
MYRGIHVLLITKIDLLPYIDFDMDYFRRASKRLTPAWLPSRFLPRPAKAWQAGSNGCPNKWNR